MIFNKERDIKMQLFRAIQLTVFVFAMALTAGCATRSDQTGGLSRHAYYEKMQGQYEQQARNGAIKWAEAVEKTRDLDKSLAEDQGIIFKDWKYDQDDDEYHSYCLALAERLDRRQISFAQFDAGRKARFNQIVSRRQSLNAADEQNRVLREKLK
jgi:hypothetical protein